MKSILIILILLTPFILLSQEREYASSTILVSQFYDQIIESEYSESGENYFAPPVRSLLYTLPINCDSAIELTPCNNYDWFSKEKFIYGENINDRKVYLFTRKGKVFKELDNAELFYYGGGNMAIFIREYITRNESDRINPQVIMYDFRNDEEIILFEFDKTKYTFHSPNDPDGPGLPKKFDPYYGGIRGNIFSTDFNVEGTFTFVIDIQTKKLKFWLNKYWRDTDISNSIPYEGIIKNGN